MTDAQRRHKHNLDARMRSVPESIHEDDFVFLRKDYTRGSTDREKQMKVQAISSDLRTF